MVSTHSMQDFKEVNELFVLGQRGSEQMASCFEQWGIFFFFYGCWEADRRQPVILLRVTWWERSKYRASVNSTCSLSSFRPMFCVCLAWETMKYVNNKTLKVPKNQRSRRHLSCVCALPFSLYPFSLSALLKKVILVCHQFFRSLWPKILQGCIKLDWVSGCLIGKMWKVPTISPTSSFYLFGSLSCSLKFLPSQFVNFELRFAPGGTC